jgi:hypothetical protein
VVKMQLGLVSSVNDGSVEKLEGVLLLMNNFVGFLKEHSLPTIDILFQPILAKIKLIPVP